MSSGSGAVALGSIVTVALTGILFLGGVAKLRRPNDFRQIVRSWRMFPDALVAPSPKLVGGGEVVLATCLILGLPGAPAVVAAALGGLLMVSAGAARRSPGALCGCLSMAHSPQLGRETLLRDGLLTCLALTLALGWPSGVISLPAVLAGTTLVMMVVLADSMVAVRQSWALRTGGPRTP